MTEQAALEESLKPSGELGRLRRKSQLTLDFQGQGRLRVLHDPLMSGGAPERAGSQ